jgi:hypothetical protein
LEFVAAPDSGDRDTYENKPREYIRKAAVELLAISDGDLRRGIGGRSDAKVYPFKQKSRVPVNLQLNLQLNAYAVTGSIHCSQRQTIQDVLNDDRPFLALTDVAMPHEFHICGTKPFIALNKQQIISCREEPLGETS